MHCFPLEVGPFSVMMRSYPAQLSLSLWSPGLCGEAEFWQSADLMPAGVQAGWGYSAGIQLVSAGYSGGCRKGRCLPSFVWAKRPRKTNPMHACIRTLEHTRTNVLKICPNLYLNWHKSHGFPGRPHYTTAAPPLPSFFFFSPSFVERSQSCLGW